MSRRHQVSQTQKPASGPDLISLMSRPQVCHVQVSPLQVRLQPSGRGPRLLLLRGRCVQGEAGDI